MTVTDSQTGETLNQHEDVLTIVSDTNSEAWREGFSIEAQVFMESGYVLSEEDLAGEYERYLPATRFIVARRDGGIGGSVRAVNYRGGVGFKTIDDLEAGKLETSPEGKELLANLPLEQTLEVGTLAVKRELRGIAGEEDRLAVILYGAIYGLTQQTSCNYVIASFDAKFYRRFKMIFDPGVEPLGPATPYMGSPTVPALLHVPTFMEHTKNTLPGIYDMMTDAAAKLYYD